MAVIKNIIQTQFTSTGAAGVTKDVETLNRSQTRLGQTSASAGRAFAAQASGLGGLVAAYAGAAATVFALQQAFSALAKAAQAETIVQGTKTLALEIGQSGPQILKSIQAITQGQLTLAEAAQNANIALSAGFNTRQIEGFTTVAMKASKALGRDFTDSLQRVVRGVSKLEPELLDELGIFTRLDPAVRAYAKQLGVSVASLSEFQRRQAFANAAIDEGLRKFGAIDTTSASAQKSLERLQVQISELSTAFLQIVANALVPFIDFITNNAGNAIAAFGLLLTLVFKKAGQELGGWAANSIKKLSRYADNVAKTASQTKASFADIGKAAAELEKDISQRGSLSADGGRFAQAKVEKDLATEAARARQRFRDIEKTPLSPSQIESDIKTLKKVQEQVNANSSAYRDANRIVLAYSTALQGAGLQVKALTFSSKALNIAAVGLSLAFRGLTIAVNSLFTGIAIAQLVGTIFDIDIISEIKNKIAELTQASKDLKNGFTGAVLAASGGSQDLVKRLQNIGASSSYIENISDTIVDLRNRVEQEATGLQASLVVSAQANEGFVSNFLRSFARAMSGMGGQQEIAAINAEAEKRLIQADRIVAIDNLILQQKQKLSDANAQERADILANIEVYKVLKQELIEFGGFYSELIGQLSRSTGLGAEQIGQIFKDAPLDSLIQRAENSLTIFGQSIETIDGKFSLENATKQTKDLVDAGIIASRTVRDLRDGLQAGGISATALGSKIDGLNTQLAVAKEALNAQTDAAVRSSQVNENLRNSVTELESSIAVYTKLRDEVAQIETTIKSLDQAFGSDIGRTATLQYTGLVSLNQQLATSQEQQIANQNEFLMALAASTQKSAELAGNKEKTAAKARELNLNADQTAAFVEKTNREAELFDKTIQAIVGRIINLTSEFSTLASELTKSTAEIEKQIGAIAFEEGALNLQLQLDTTNIRYQLEEQLRDLQVQQLQADINLIQSQRAAGIKTELQAIQDVNAKQIQIIELQVAAETARYNNVKENLRVQGELNLQNYNAEEDAIEARRVAAVEEARSRLESLRNQANQFRGLLSAQNENFQEFNIVLADVLTQGATAFVKAIKEGIETTITPGAMAEPDFTVLDSAITAADAAFQNFEDAQNRLAERQGNLAFEKYNAENTRLAEQAAAEEQLHTANIRRIATENATRENNHKAELNRLGKEAAEEAKKRREALAQFLQDFSQTLSQVFDFVNQLVTGIFEGKIIQARQNEEFITSVLADTSERLSTAQSELNSSLELEASLREELIDATNTLLESQNSYLVALGRQNEEIAASSKEYVQNLLAQKRTILELADANRNSLALGKQVTSLEEMQTSLQQALADVTASRIKLENKLAATQEILGAVAQAVTGQINMLADSLRNLGNAAAGGGPAGAKPTEVSVTNLGSVFTPLANTLKTAVTEAAAAASGKAAVATAAGQTTEATELLAASNMLSQASAVISNAVSGFNIGKAIGVALGTDGVASGIGGAIGSVVGMVFKTQIAGFLASTTIGSAVVTGVTTALGGAAASALGTLFTAAIPVFGAIIGGLLGSLFATKPRGQATGVLTAEGFETTSMSGKKVDPKALASIPEQALMGVVTSLKRAGISFVDTVKTGIDFYKKGISNATLEFADGLKETFSGGTVQEAGQFFVDAFFKGVRVERDEAGLVTFRSLVVDALTPNRETIQNAVDQFAELSDAAEKTVKRFEEVVQFATEFNDTLAKLRGPATSTAQAINLITAAAQQNSSVVANYYRTFLADTARTFGDASVEYTQALDAVQANALAQLGLAKTTRSGVTEIRSLTEAQSELNAGFLLVTDIIAKARGSVDMLTAAGFENIGDIIETSINTQLVDAVTTTAQALTRTLDVIRTPAKAAVFELEDLLTGSTDRIGELRGKIDGITAAIEEGLEVDPSILATAQDNLQAAQELTGLETNIYIKSLSEAQLEAIISTNQFTDAINNLAQAQLNYLQLVSSQKATASLLSAGRRLSKTISDITGQFNLFRVNGLMGIATDLDTLTKNLGQTEVSSFTVDLNKMLISIANGQNISRNLTDSINLLNEQLDAGTLTSEQYAYGIEQVITTTEQYLETLTELSKEYQSTISQISGAFNQSKDTVISTIQELGSQIISLTNNISSKTSEILGIYDDTLASVAESGNELFDLRDTAKDAFETASRAVKEFERSNKLSGKSVETLRGELSSVEAEIASLVSADNLDFSGFLLLTELGSKQNALKKEINSVVAVESEYQDLLDTRTTALEDLSFVEATLATLDDNLVDTRRKESEIIKKTQDATTSFISAQQELQDITALLAESNFNLNQIRFDEESAVTRVKNALAIYNKDLENLTSTLEAIGGESGAALQSSFVKAAAGNAEVIFAGLEEAARNAKIGEATAQAVEAFDQLQALALQVSGFFEPVDEAFTGLETISVSLTDKFQQFSTDIVKYLETEGLAQFYGPGGVFFQFKETLLDTIKNQGFDVLTAPGGPLQNFNTNLMNISQAIETLSNAGNFLDITIQTAETTFGSFVTAVGTDLEKLTAGYVGLSIVGANLSDTAPDTISLYAEGIGNLNAVLDEGGSLSILLDAAEAMDSLYSSVTIVDALLNEINFEVSAQNAKDNIVTAVEIVNSTIGTIDLGVSASTMVDNITTNVDLINSTISAVDISVSATAMNEAITSAVGTIDSTLTGVDLTTSTASMVSAIDTTVTTLDTALSGVDLTDSTSAMVAAIDASVETLNNTLTGVDLTSGTESAVAAITTSADTVTETLSGVDLTTGTDSAVAAITTSAETVIETLTGVDLTLGTESAVAAITTSAETVIETLTGVDLTAATSSMVDTITTNVTLLNSTIGEVDLTTSTAVMVEAINTTVTTLNSTLEGLSLGTATDSAVGKLSETITAINSTLSNIAFSDAEDVAVGAITNTIEAINSVLERIDLTDVTNSAVGKIEVSISALQSVLDGIDLVEISESTVNKFNAVVEAIVSTLDTIDLVEVTNSTVSKLKATITAMESTLASIDLVEVTESTVEKFEVAVIAIKSTLEDISLTSVTDSAIGEFNALATAIESTLSSIDLTTVTDSTVNKLTTVVSTIDSTLAAIDFVEVTNSTVDKINTLAETTNSTLSDVSFVTATESVVGEINSVNELVNSNLSEVSFVSSLQSAVDEINLVNSSVNSTLESVDFVTTLSSAVDEIALVNTNINSTLSDVNYSTSLDSVISEITLVNTNINSALSNVTYSTNLESVIGEISTVNEDINSSLSDVIFVSSLSSAVREINAVTGTLNSTLDEVDFVVSTDSVVEKINAYNTAVNSALSNVALVTATESAVGEINAVNTSINSTLENVDFAVALNSVVEDITAVSVDLNSALDKVDFVVTTDTVVEKVSAYNVAVNSALSNIALVDSTSSVVEKIEAVQVAINSTLEGITLVSATDSAVNSILAAVEAIDSTLTDVTLVDATASTVDAIKAAIAAIDATLNDVTLVTSTETVTGAITAVISAINSTLNDVTLVDATNSAVDEIDAAILAIESTLNDVNLVTAKNSAVGEIDAAILAIESSLNNVNLVTATNSATSKIAAVASSINSTLSSIDLTAGTNSAIKEITDYNSEVNAALGNVSLSAETANVVSEIAGITQINVELGKISLSVNLANAKSNISAVGTDLNAVLKGISLSTDLETAKAAISKVNTDLNARLAAVAVETNLSQARTRIDAVNTDLNARLAAINLATNLNQATTRIDGVSTSINTSLSNVNLSNATAVFDALVAVFTQTATDKVTAFKNAIAAFANITTEITNTQGLATEIANLAGDTGSVKSLIDRFSSLQDTINSLTGTTGISALQTQINKIATDLSTAWSNIRLNTTAIPVTASADVNVTGVSLGYTDSQYLATIAGNSAKYPRIQGVSYAGFFSEGGLVEGPGTSTSDSIPARLSDGEYVLRTSAVNKLDRDFLNTLNESGDLSTALAAMGRRGDTQLAHITRQEMLLLKRAGGSGTRNPMTGLIEFFNKDAGALGRMFAAQEADLLWKTYGPKILQDRSAVVSYSGDLVSQGMPETHTFTAPSSSPFALSLSQSVDNDQNKPELTVATNNLFKASDKSSILNSAASTMLTLNEMFKARGANTLLGLSSKYAQHARKWTGNWFKRSNVNYHDRQFIDADLGGGYSRIAAHPNIGWGPHTTMDGGPWGPQLGSAQDSRGGYPTRYAQALTNIVDRTVGAADSYNIGDLMAKGTIESAISKLNAAYPNFADFYMLDKTRGTAPAYTSGGLVRGQRDSEISALEPGEFVLRKAAVEQMGLDAAYKLNATGDVGGDTNVEVNITNNGAPVNVAATPQIRRENGKIVLDIILEDIRNNGPIRQQIRSIR